MEIIFGQYFDQGYYLNYSKKENQNIFNKVFIGPMGLLSLLERDLGFSGVNHTMLERKVKYREILKQYVQQNTDNLFAGSFTIDPDGVTEELLRYRDQLVLVGWKATIKGISAKIDLLAKIEESAIIPDGPEDRWIKVLKYIQENENATLGFEKIWLNESAENLHPYFRLLLNILTERGLEVKELLAEYPINSESNLGKIKNNILGATPVELNINDRTSLQILRFKSDSDAAEFLASQWNNLNDAVIFNRDNRHFDEMLNSFGLPVSGSDQVNSNPTLIQLFKLITVLIVKPLNIHNLLSYLQVEVNPIPASLRYKLMNVLKNTGGMNNPEWNKTIDEYDFKNKEVRNRTVNFLTVRNYPEGQIDKNGASQLFHALESWTQERMILGENTPEINSQLAYLIELCQAIREILNNYQEETLSDQELSMIISGIYEPQTFNNYVPQVGSCRVLANPCQLIDFPETCIWLDFYNETMSPAFYSFLNAEECRNLAQQNIQIWSISEQVSSRMGMLLKGLLIPVKKCILMVVEKCGAQGVTDHPVHSYLKVNMPGIENITTEVNAMDSTILNMIDWPQPETVEQNTIRFPEKEKEYRIERGTLIPKRETESTSSMELLIQNPFDWVFQYGAQIQPGNSYQLDDIFTTKGKVAHKFIEVLFTEANNELDKAREMLENYDLLLQSVVQGYGMILLLDENRFEFEIFKTNLRHAVLNLIDILEVNQLSIVGMELSKTAQIPLIGNQEVLGKIDLVLTKPNGHKAIFDLKWSRRPNKFYTMIKENKHIQLAVYKKLLEIADSREVDFVAYYSLSDARLITTENLAGSSVNYIENAGSTDEILTRAGNSLSYRRTQLENGIIEEAGGGEMAELDYYLNQEQENLVPLETEYKSTGIKKVNSYSEYKTFKGDIK